MMGRDWMVFRGGMASKIITRDVPRSKPGPRQGASRALPLVNQRRPCFLPPENICPNWRGFCGGGGRGRGLAVEGLKQHGLCLLKANRHARSAIRGLVAAIAIEIL